MPTLETPPNPAPTTPPRPGQTPVKVTTRRFGELEEHELIHLLDSIDDEIARARFRESIYVSIIICLALAWFAFYGPRVLFHEGRIVNPKDEVTELNKKELPFLDLPKSLVQKVPPKPKAISDQTHTAQTPHPDQRPPTPRRGAPGTPSPAPRPLPPEPQPQQQAQQQPQPRLQPTPQPQQPRQAQSTPIPDAPKPTQSAQQPTRPNFGAQESPQQAMRDLAGSMARGEGGNFSANAPGGHGSNLGEGVEILSDTLGVDFGPYIKRLLRILYDSWIPLIPEETRPPLNKEGSTLIRFTINKDGSLQPGGMHLDASTHDEAIDRAAWGSITGVGQMPPLPKGFTGPNLELRINFIISHNAPKNDF